ncbi:hypothetical protein ABMA75_00730 [Halobacteriovorax sp. ZH4_bin.1]|uniref:hypothetical protein n=2 Tax=unclassified Halobacteriovorax TaxID=2639665 RepID=UPI0037213B2D
MDMKSILTLLLSTYVLGASPVTISEFSNSLENELGLKLSRLDDVVQKVRVRKPNVFEKWLMNKSGAEATYNDKTNTIVLREKNWRGRRIVSLSDFPKGQEYQFSILASTIFHELMHADFDVLIKGSRTRTDIALKNTQRWFSQNIPGVNAHIAAHEFFGYTASDLILGIKSKLQDIYLAHGINSYKNTCFGRRGLERIKKRLFPDGDIQFKDTLNIPNFAKEFTPDTIFVKGQDINIKDKKFPESFRNEVYRHFVENYHAPATSQDLLEIARRQYGNLLQKCFEDI